MNLSITQQSALASLFIGNRFAGNPHEINQANVTQAIGTNNIQALGIAMVIMNLFASRAGEDADLSGLVDATSGLLLDAQDENGNIDEDGAEHVAGDDQAVENAQDNLNQRNTTHVVDGRTETVDYDVDSMGNLAYEDRVGVQIERSVYQNPTPMDSDRLSFGAIEDLLTEANGGTLGADEDISLQTFSEAARIAEERAEEQGSGTGLWASLNRFAIEVGNLALLGHNFLGEHFSLNELAAGTSAVDKSVDGADGERYIALNSDGNIDRTAFDDIREAAGI